MKDYLAYLQDNPRFGKMFEPVTRASVERLANAIQYAGHPDDPLYRMRIMATARDPLIKHALWQFDRWPPG
jgi:flagellum-specific peptidoglycan hydrolase FlgJ